MTRLPESKRKRIEERVKNLDARTASQGLRACYAAGAEWMANPIRSLDIVYKPWPEIMNDRASALLQKLKDAGVE